MRWTVREDASAAPQLCVDWRETGVTDLPAPDAPARCGYGRELIERALPFQLGARTDFRFTGDGVHCTIEIPLPEQPNPKDQDHDRT